MYTMNCLTQIWTDIEIQAVTRIQHCIPFFCFSDFEGYSRLTQAYLLTDGKFKHLVLFIKTDSAQIADVCESETLISPFTSVAVRIIHFWAQDFKPHQEYVDTYLYFVEMS